MLTVVLEATGQLSFKAAASHPQSGDGLARWKHMLSRPWIWVGGGCYVFEFLGRIAFLSLIPLGRGLLLGSINIVVLILAGRMLFGERITRMRLFGIVLVSVGVALVGAGS
jgi:drug/metabolite transporter (DMT)-like permease